MPENIHIDKELERDLVSKQKLIDTFFPAELEIKSEVARAESAVEHIEDIYQGEWREVVAEYERECGPFDPNITSEEAREKLVVMNRMTSAVKEAAAAGNLTPEDMAYLASRGHAAKIIDGLESLTVDHLAALQRGQVFNSEIFKHLAGRITLSSRFIRPSLMTDPDEALLGLEFYSRELLDGQERFRVRDLFSKELFSQIIDNGQINTLLELHIFEFSSEELEAISNYLGAGQVGRYKGDSKLIESGRLGKHPEILARLIDRDNPVFLNNAIQLLVIYSEDELNPIIGDLKNIIRDNPQSETLREHILALCQLLNIEESQMVADGAVELFLSAPKEAKFLSKFRQKVFDISEGKRQTYSRKFDSLTFD